MHTHSCLYLQVGGIRKLRLCEKSAEASCNICGGYTEEVCHDRTQPHRQFARNIQFWSPRPETICRYHHARQRLAGAVVPPGSEGACHAPLTSCRCRRI